MPSSFSYSKICDGVDERDDADVFSSSSSSFSSSSTSTTSHFLSIDLRHSSARLASSVVLPYSERARRRVSSECDAHRRADRRRALAADTASKPAPRSPLAERRRRRRRRPSVASSSSSTSTSPTPDDDDDDDSNVVDGSSAGVEDEEAGGKIAISSSFRHVESDDDDGGGGVRTAASNVRSASFVVS
jgi:hypothetical protein